MFVVRFRRSFPIAAYLTYPLAQAGKRTILVDGVAELQALQMRGMHKNDLLATISLSPYGSETTNIVDEAAIVDVPVIAISDRVISPIAQKARLVLQVRETEIRGFRSLSAPMRLVRTLAIAFATITTNEITVG